jgi:hypothetical protein
MSLLAPIAAAAELDPLQSEALSFLLSGASAGAGEALALSPEPEVVLGRRERAAILMSLRDGRASVTGSRRWKRFTRIAFGLQPPASLADVRLEALRRYATLYRIEGAALSIDEDERLLAAGVPDRHAAAARTLVDTYYVPDRDRRRVPWTLAAMIALAAFGAVFFDRWLAAQFDDAAGALIVTLLLAAWGVSFAAVTGHPRAQRTSTGNSFS